MTKYLNNRLEAGHGATKRRIRSMLGFKSAKEGYDTLKGIELMRMIRNSWNRGGLRPREESAGHS